MIAEPIREKGESAMKPGIIIYKSIYGATEAYAKMLAPRTGYDLLPVKEAGDVPLEEYEHILYGGGVYAGQIIGIEYLKRHWNVLEGKKVLVFAVGASAFSPAVYDALREKNLRGRLENLPLCYCRGRWNVEKMTWMDRLLCRRMEKTAVSDPSTDPWQAALREAAGRAMDWVDEKELGPILMILGFDAPAAAKEAASPEE